MSFLRYVKGDDKPIFFIMRSTSPVSRRTKQSKLIAFFPCSLSLSLSLVYINLPKRAQVFHCKSPYQKNSTTKFKSFFFFFLSKSIAMSQVLLTRSLFYFFYFKSDYCFMCLFFWVFLLFLHVWYHMYDGSLWINMFCFSLDLL